MDIHIKEFFFNRANGDKGPIGHFHRVVPLHEEPDLSWEEVRNLLPEFPRGWYELAHLTPEDRVSFTAEYWNSKIPFDPHVNESLGLFFSNLDDIGVFLTQKKFDDPYDATMVYSIGDNGGFYRGYLPATYDECMAMQSRFTNLLFPDDYFAFLQIHNGFRKTTDSTGILCTDEIYDVFKRLQELVSSDDVITTRSGEIVNPETLIPFYESFGLPQYQCFWEEWYNEHGMGNVYYSLSEKVISDPDKGESGAECLAFPTFSQWLAFYLERIG